MNIFFPCFNSPNIDLRSYFLSPTSALASIRSSKAELLRGFEETLPSVKGEAARLGIALLNILQNAIQSLEKKGFLTIRTRGKTGFVASEAGVGTKVRVRLPAV